MGETPTGRDRPGELDRFLDDLRRTGTVISGPVVGEAASEWEDPPVEWLVSAHRGQPVDLPYRLALDERGFTEALRHDAEVVEGWWPGGDPLARAYEALLLGFDAALVGIDRTPHRFVLEEDDRLHLTTHHPCPQPWAHVDPESGNYFWSAYEPGDPEFEEALARQSRQSRHRRHAGLVRAWLVVEAAMDTARIDPAVPYLQEQVETTFGPGTVSRFQDYLQARGLPDDAIEAELADMAYNDDDRLDALLDALAGEPRDG